LIKTLMKVISKVVTWGVTLLLNILPYYHEKKVV
jgi:hypothetical protein